MDDDVIPIDGELVKLSEFFPEGTKAIHSYQKLDKIGEGTFGEVFKARDKETGEIVALKKHRLDEPEGVLPYLVTAVLEVKILRELNHENVIKLKETIYEKPDKRIIAGGYNDKGVVHMIFEYMEHDLAGLLNQPDWSKSLTPPQIKCYMKQLLMGLHYCHANRILHRDIKALNILINNEGILKLGDFGLATSIAGIPTDKELTNDVITLSYRPPELLLGATKYGPEVDIWSAGCILGELLNRKQIFPGKSEADTIYHIFKLCGTPDDNNWPEALSLPFYTKFEPLTPIPRRLGEVYDHFEKHALDLLERMLTLDPKQRISAEDALKADYFCTDPLPSDPKSLRKFESSHYYEVKKKRKQESSPSKKYYGSQPAASSSLHPHRSPPSPPRLHPRKRRSVRSQGGHGGGRAYEGRGGSHIPQGNGSSQGASGSSSGYGDEAPNYSHRSRDIPSSSGAGGSGGKDSNYPPVLSRDVSSSCSHGGGRGANGSAYEGGAPSQPHGGFLKSDKEAE